METVVVAVIGGVEHSSALQCCPIAGPTVVAAVGAVEAVVVVVVGSVEHSSALVVLVVVLVVLVVVVVVVGSVEHSRT